MARIGLTKHRKFLRLARAVGDDARALGSLEFLWEACYESGDDYVGQSDDIEAFARWRGEPGVLTRALVDAGGEGNIGFLEEMPDRRGHYRVHDLYDHAPKYVKDRMKREAEREAAGVTISEIRAAAARAKHASRPVQPSANGQQPSANDMQVSANDSRLHNLGPANGSPPAPALAPALAPTPPNNICSEPPKAAASEPPAFSIACIGTGPKIFHVTQGQIDKWAKAFPAVDIAGEIRRAIVWLDANPTKRKRHTGMASYLTKWFGRVQDRGGSGAARAGPGAPQQGLKSPAHRAQADAQWIEDYEANHGNNGETSGIARKDAGDGDADVFGVQRGIPGAQL